LAAWYNGSKREKSVNTLSDSPVVHLRTPGGSIAGSGILVSESQVLVSAHVVADSLGVSPETREKPIGTVYLDFPQAPRGEILTGHITLWQPELDIARLELDKPASTGAQTQGDQAQAKHSIRLRNLILFSALAALVIIVFWATLNLDQAREVGAKTGTTTSVWPNPVRRDTWRNPASRPMYGS